MNIIFNTTTGDDVEITVEGSYEQPDDSVGYGGSFWIEKIYLPTDLCANDIQSLISKKSTARIEDTGMQKGAEGIYEAKQDVLCAKHERQMDNLRGLL